MTARLKKVWWIMEVHDWLIFFVPGGKRWLEEAD
jgi:hypothetical protein